MDFDLERYIGEMMAEVLRERLIELETLEASGAAPEDAISRLAENVDFAAPCSPAKASTGLTGAIASYRAAIAFSSAATAASERRRQSMKASRAQAISATNSSWRIVGRQQSGFSGLFIGPRGRDRRACVPQGFS
jgi:hypothetical protein